MDWSYVLKERFKLLDILSNEPLLAEEYLDSWIQIFHYFRRMS